MNWSRLEFQKAGFCIWATTSLEMHEAVFVEPRKAFGGRSDRYTRCVHFDGKSRRVYPECVA